MTAYGRLRAFGIGERRGLDTVEQTGRVGAG
jgi:hypothetical protein